MNFFRSIQLPPKVTRGEEVKADDHNRLIDALRACIARAADAMVQPSADIGVKRNGASGILLFLKHPARGGSSSAGGACPFGKIVATDEDTPGKAILGGLITCGDQNFNVSDQTVNPETDGEWLVQITLSGIECATDDDGEIFLPGVITATGSPAWDLKEWTDPTDYDPNTNPTGPSSPNGSIVLPIGRLRITDGNIVFIPTGCGNFGIAQCAGILSYTRS